MPQKEPVHPSRTDASDKKLADDTRRWAQGEFDPRYLKAKATAASMGIPDPDKPLTHKRTNKRVAFGARSVSKR